MKIIWTIDPFAKDKDLQRSAGMLIQALTEGHQSEIHPIYVWGVYPAPLEFDLPPNYWEKVKESAQKSFNSIAGRAKLNGLKPITVITGSYLPIKEGAEEVISFARKLNADLIVASTHARKGSKRWTMGSFAETLMFTSDLPLIIVNPNLKSRPKMKDILFPTDFSAESKQAYKKVIEFARQRGSCITLFYKASFPALPTLDPAFGSHPQTDPFLKAVESKRLEASQWANEGKSNQVEVSPYIDLDARSSAADAILKYSKKKPGIIAMAAHSGAFRRILLGSTTRKVVRGAEYPVWIIHS